MPTPNGGWPATQSKTRRLIRSGMDRLPISAIAVVARSGAMVIYALATIPHKQNPPTAMLRWGFADLGEDPANVHGSSGKLTNRSPAKKSPGPFWAAGALSLVRDRSSEGLSEAAIHPSRP